MRKLALVLCLIVLASAGCAYTMPPQKIPMDRRNYLDAASTSWKEQLLTNLVKLRYGDTLTFLEITGINTNYGLDTSLSANYPIIWNYLTPIPGGSPRNTVTPGGSITYTDHPNINYNVMRGDALANTMIEPMDPTKILKGLQTGWGASYVLSCCVKSINRLRNRSWSGKVEADPDFFDLAKLFGELKSNGIIRVTVEEPAGGPPIPTKYDVTLHKTWQGKEKVKPGEEPAVKEGKKPNNGKKNGKAMCKNNEEKKVSAIGKLVLDEKRAEELDDLANRDEAYTKRSRDDGIKAKMVSDQENSETNKVKFADKIKRFKQLLGGGQDVYEYEIIDGNQNQLPAQSCDKIVIQTRSVLEILNLLSQFIDVPEDHQENPQQLIKNRASKNMLTGKPLNDFNKKVSDPSELMFEIRCSKDRPRDAFAAIKHCDYWFYIDDKDHDTKDVFSSTQGILSMSETSPSQTPILTLPVQ